MPKPEVALAENATAPKKMPSWRTPASYSCSSATSAIIEPNATKASCRMSPWTNLKTNKMANRASSPFSGSQPSSRSTTGNTWQTAHTAVPRITPERLPAERSNGTTRNTPSSRPSTVPMFNHSISWLASSQKYWYM